VMGYVKRGWKGSPSLEVLELERLDRFDNSKRKLS